MTSKPDERRALELIRAHPVGRLCSARAALGFLVARIVRSER